MSGCCSNDDNILIRILHYISTALNAQIVELWMVENSFQFQRICACRRSGESYSTLEARCKASNMFCELLQISAKQYHFENVPEELARNIFEDFGIHFESVMTYRMECSFSCSNSLHLVAYSTDPQFLVESKLDCLLSVQEVIFVALKQLYDDEEDDFDNNFDKKSDQCLCGKNEMDELDVTHHYVDRNRLRPKRAPHGMFSIMEESEEDTDDEIVVNETNFSEMEQTQSSIFFDELDSKNYVPIHRVKVDGNFEKSPCDMLKVPLNCIGESTDSILLTPRDTFSPEDCCYLDCEGNSTIHLHDEKALPKQCSEILSSTIFSR